MFVDLPKVRTWDEQNEEYVEQLETDGLKLLEFGGLATVAFYTGRHKNLCPNVKPKYDQ